MMEKTFSCSSGLIFGYVVLAVATVKKKKKTHKATKEEHIGTPDILVMSVSEPKRRVHTFPFIILI